MDSFEQGEDIYREPTLEIGGVAANTADFDIIEVDVYHKHSLIKIGEYSLAAGTVTKELPTTSGVISFIISRTENQEAQTGIYAYEVETTEADADYDGDVRHRKYKGDSFDLISSNE